MVSLLIYMHRLFTEKCALVSAGGILTHVPNSSPSLPPPNGREGGREGGRRRRTGAFSCQKHVCEHVNKLHLGASVMLTDSTRRGTSSRTPRVTPAVEGGGWGGVSVTTDQTATLPFSEARGRKAENTE